MIVSFDVEKFKGDPRALIDVLSSLYRVGGWRLGHYAEVEEVVCRTPSSALKFCRMVNHSYGISSSAEKVFLKNPGIGIHYLRLVGRSEFLDEKVQKRFWRKITRSPDLAYEWARTFNRRLSEQEEEVFVKNISRARDYALYVARGAFPEKIHKMLVLRSFESLDNLSKSYLSEYLRYAESSSKKQVAHGR